MYELTEFQKALAEIEALKNWIRRNADHAGGCSGFLIDITNEGSEVNFPCTCGLRALLPDFDTDFSTADQPSEERS